MFLDFKAVFQHRNISDKKNVCSSEITALLRHDISFFEENVVLRLWNRKGKAVKKWRSRAWSIDPNKTNLTIVTRKEKLSQHVPPWVYKKWLSSQIS
jgi:activator of HSP90 ATPase